MSVSSISSYASQAVAQSPTVRTTDGGFRAQPVQPVEAAERETTAQQQQETAQNTEPTEQERQQALQSGRTRGSFVNITA